MTECNFPKGQRVKYSERGRQTFRRSPYLDRLGTVTSWSRAPHLVTVLWDGTKGRTRLHVDFVVPIEGCVDGETATEQKP